MIFVENHKNHVFFTQKLRSEIKYIWVLASNEYILVYTLYRYKALRLALKNIHKNMFWVY
jgi:hypothetical protein